MSENEDTYCRLCAEPTPVTQLISPDEIEVFTPKVAAKLSWINIDISTPNGLPKTICYSCFDLLNRTWSFLNNVRTAQEKLKAIFVKKTEQNNKQIIVETNEKQENVPGKPVDKNWEDFQRPKIEIKIEESNDKVPIVKNSVLIPDGSDCDLIKAENDTDNEDLHIESSHNGFLSSSDSDSPLKNIAKKKKFARKRKKVSKSDDNSDLPIDIPSFNITWDNQSCRCAKCDALCQSIMSLQLHSLQIHNQCCLFKCIDCEKIVSTYRSIVRHIRTHNNALRHCCEYCNKVFLRTSELNIHKVKDHKDIYKTKCTYCGTSFETEDELKEHKSIFFNSSKRISKNVKVVNDEKQSNCKCDLCDKVFKNRQNLYQHRVLHTERSRNFACHVCGKMYYTKGSLSAHMRTHEEAKPYKCDHCPRAFHAKGNLISHLSLHSGLKPFICEQCGKSFRVKRHLISHSIVHTDLRPYVCEYCNKTFRFKTRLNLHVRQHTGVRPYKCVYCQRDFTNGSNHKKHMYRRHGIDTSSRNKYNVVYKEDE
ncbi:zinc finger protein 724-like [Melitaea cinxia]|uniref:zinc finger protein 724-like n=1 Tax=Melitaea cinxia TaxID=113334 RepID=UPI001E273837|nr:zinc finger protein 724-like [Melitaea cinxia]